LIIIPVPWEVTVSYSSGTAQGPEAILKASSQVDLYQSDIAGAWKMGIHMLPVPEDLRAMGSKYRSSASKYIQWLESGSPGENARTFAPIPGEVDQACREMEEWVYQKAK